jgi:hypothetical protein
MTAFYMFRLYHHDSLENLEEPPNPRTSVLRSGGGAYIWVVGAVAGLVPE